jgi:cold shock protein
LPFLCTVLVSRFGRAIFEPAPDSHGGFVDMRGTIAKLKADRGFGFIRPDDGGKEFFFHRSGVAEDAYDKLHDGQIVEFETENSAKGPRATNVRPVA